MQAQLQGGLHVAAARCTLRRGALNLWLAGAVALHAHRVRELVRLFEVCEE